MFLIGSCSGGSFWSTKCMLLQYRVDAICSVTLPGKGMLQVCFNAYLLCSLLSSAGQVIN